ncbi:MAG: tryptophan synthase subunit alpha [Acidimicrobiia bacterium]|nr:tryptophan synthase subunit alpha [Acidimicrobiia bacterium]
MTRISKLFERVKRDGEPALIAYLTAGDPDGERTVALVRALEKGGADLIELGVPFSDPIADGPVIQRASDRALRAGASLKGVLEIARKIRAESEIPLLLFSYMNPLVRFGFGELAREAVKSGIDGVLITDLSVEEADGYVKCMREAGLDTVFLAAPTSTPRRLELVARYSTGFVYLVSRTGVTGEREQVSDSVGPLVESVRKVTDLPLAVGFGIKSAEQAAEVGKVGDGVVVGSAIVRLIEEYGKSAELETKLEALARELKQGMRRRT